jgi:ESX-1-secreted protein regulator
MSVDKAAGPDREGSATAAEHSLADKVEWLIQHMWPAGVSTPKSNSDVAEAITGATGEEISHSTVWKLRTGRQPNPTLRTLRALAAFFRVPIGYFGDDEQADSIEDQLMTLVLLRDTGVDRAALRAFVDLSEDGRRMIAEMIASVARMERRRTAD